MKDDLSLTWHTLLFRFAEMESEAHANLGIMARHVVAKRKRCTVECSLPPDRLKSTHSSAQQSIRWQSRWFLKKPISCPQANQRGNWGRIHRGSHFRSMHTRKFTCVQTSSQGECEHLVLLAEAADLCLQETSGEVAGCLSDHGAPRLHHSVVG